MPYSFDGETTRIGGAYFSLAVDEPSASSYEIPTSAKFTDVEPARVALFGATT
ncbi:hypothetical protein PGB90_007246 [Kerria lacca]